MPCTDMPTYIHTYIYMYINVKKKCIYIKCWSWIKLREKEVGRKMKI